MLVVLLTLLLTPLRRLPPLLLLLPPAHPRVLHSSTPPPPPPPLPPLQNGVRVATPLLLVLLVVELSDVVFAVDSIPAVREASETSGAGVGARRGLVGAPPAPARMPPLNAPQCTCPLLLPRCLA